MISDWAYNYSLGSSSRNVAYKRLRSSIAWDSGSYSGSSRTEAEDNKIGFQPFDIIATGVESVTSLPLISSISSSSLFLTFVSLSWFLSSTL